MDCATDPGGVSSCEVVYESMPEAAEGELAVGSKIAQLRGLGSPAGVSQAVTADGSNSAELQGVGSPGDVLERLASQGGELPAGELREAASQEAPSEGDGELQASRQEDER